MTIRKAGVRRTRAGESQMGAATALLVAGLMVEIAVGIAAIVRPPTAGASPLVLAAGLAIGSVVIVTRSALSQRAKAVTIVVLCALLLALSASQDPFGMRAVGQEMVVDQREDPLAAIAQADNDRPVAQVVTLRSAGADADAQAAAVDLARLANADVAVADAKVDGTLALTGPSTARTYELNWSLARADDRLWCGRVTVAAPTRTIALAQMGSRLTDALARSREGALRCA